ncbi:Glycogenin-1 [Bagarius yarrelli]|uniref:Glycogenin-1 n=1 Tax=Bagarius yarrelli TaxID=175774 RepID=A0A556TKX7_BAGYA|nr:Glycogenin-1 [Bagarius yarrelli]
MAGIISAVAVAVFGAASSYFAYQKKKLCFKVQGEAFVTLATSDAYCMGSRVVGSSLRRHGTTRKLVVMVSPDISRETCLSLEDLFDEVIVVDMLDSKDIAHLFWLGRPDLGVTFTKLHCWTLTQYSKCVFLDADTLRSPLSASLPAVPPHPHSSESVPQAEDKEEKMLSELPEKARLDAASLSTCYQLEDVCSHPDVVSAGHPEVSENYKLQEPPDEQKQEEEEVSGVEYSHSEATSNSATIEALKENLEHRKRWEEGHIDYLGKDAFENIRLKLDQFLE